MWADTELARRALAKIKGPNGKAPRTAEDMDAARDYIKKKVLENVYGVLPPKPDRIHAEEVSRDVSFCAGKADLVVYRLVSEYPDKVFSFPLRVVIPKTGTPCPAFVHINFRPNVPDRYQLTEEIVDRGYAVLSFCYEEVATDDGNFRAACGKYLTNGRRRADATGKIAIWAWAAMRVMDYIETIPELIDKDEVAVIGHSRLGKTALLTGAMDERFRYVISNDSGCSGAAITKDKIGETQKKITTTFPFWFCPRYVKEGQSGGYTEVDQHFLAALIPPRHLMVGSAVEDTWSDPDSEYLNVYKTNEIYRLYGMTGLVTDGERPVCPITLSDGDAHYHLRRGAHYFSREDWNIYIDYIDACRKRKEEKVNE